MLGMIELGGIPFQWRQQRPQHFAKLLSKHYPLVYFDANLGSEQITKIGEQLYLGRLRGGTIARHAMRISSKESAESLKNITKMLGIDKLILLFDYPYWEPILDFIEPYKIIYNCMDDYTEFSDLAIMKDLIDEQEKKLFKKADLVYCTSKGLYNKAKKYSNNVVIIPNGYEEKHFAYERQCSENLPYGKIVGYVGAIAEWFDQEVINYAATALPYWNFVLLGNSSVDISVLKRRENIYLFGEQDYKLAPSYMQHFDVAIIPFNVDMPIVQACNPVKYFEYSASSTVTISSPLPEVLDRKNKGDIVYIADSVEDWPPKILEAYNDSLKEGFSERIKGQVSRDTWSNRVDKLLRELKKIGC